MVQAFLIALCIALIAAAVQPVIVGQYKRFPTITTFLVAGLCLVTALVWDWLPAPAPGGLRAGLENAANDFRWWFGIVAVVWLYQISINILAEVRRNNELIGLRNDVQSIGKVIERLVLPRRLSKNQQRVITSFLSQCQPCGVVLKLIPGDEEVSGYASDFRQTLTKATWKIIKTEYSDGVREGIKINFSQTMDHHKEPQDPKNPKPDRLLQIALGLANVRVYGFGGGSSANVTEDILTIEIGRARKDSYTLDPPPDFFL